ncbi:MAG: FHA domain-containing protein [Chloroflexota bacterium]
MESYNEEVALLVAQAGPLNGQRWALRKSLLLGRESTCDIVIADRQISRHHARIHVSINGVLLEDLGSKNGTHLNGKAIKERTQLQDGDVIQIALAQKFIYLSSDATVPLDAQDTAIQTIPDEIAQIVLGSGRLRVEKRSRRVWIKQSAQDPPQEIEVIPPLSASQFRLLEVLYDNQGRVVPRGDLVAAVWGEKHAYDVSEQALDALVRRLRDRIASIDPDHDYVITVRGHGLRLDNPPV